MSAITDQFWFLPSWDKMGRNSINEIQYFDILDLIGWIDLEYFPTFWKWNIDQNFSFHEDHLLGQIDTLWRYDTESLFGRKIFTNECGFEKQLKTCEACSCPGSMSFNITYLIRNNFLS